MQSPKGLWLSELQLCPEFRVLSYSGMWKVLERKTRPLTLVEAARSGLLLFPGVQAGPSSFLPPVV